MNEWDYLVAVVRDAFARLSRGVAGKVRAINDAIEEQRALNGDGSSWWEEQVSADRSRRMDPSRDYMPDNIYYDVHRKH